jgi:hypothetical protein
MNIPEKIGRYEIIRELGRGGMAVVFLARDPLMARRVAVKLMPAQFTFNEALRARFQREARIVASLEHPAIVPVHDFGEYNEQPYLVMRYMVGGSLSQYSGGKPLPLPEIVRILAPLTLALDKAHEQHIIHRDLKPDNILFDGDKNPYLSDFGIARLAEGTQTTSIMGTPAYMSPEQITGDVELDGRSDIYALGVILFEMLSGEQPFTGETPTNIMMKHVMEPVPAILDIAGNLPAATQGIIDKAMAKKREDRYANAEEMVTAVQGLLSTTEAVEVGAAIAGTRVQETMLEVPDSPPAYQETIVESPADTQQEALYTRLQMADARGDYVEVLALGAGLQGLDANYRDVQAIIDRAKTQLTQPASHVPADAGRSRLSKVGDSAQPSVSVEAEEPPESKRPVLLLVGGIVAALILLCVVAWAAFNLINGDENGQRASSSTTSGASGLSASAGIATKEPATVEAESAAPATPIPEVDEPQPEATATIEPTPTPLPPTEEAVEPAVVPSVEELFFDDFENKSSASNWDLWQGEDAEFGIADGRLTAVGKNEEILNWTRQVDLFSEFEAHVTADILQGGRSALFGMVFAGEDEDYLGCVVQGDDSAYCAESIGGESEFTDWVIADLSTLRSDEIHFIVSQGQWAMAVNGKCIGSGSNEFITEGQVGLVVSTDSNDTPSRVAYDDLLIQSPSEQGLGLLGCAPEYFE